MAGTQGRVDLAQANFGNLPLLFVPCAAAGIVLVLAAARSLPASGALRWLSDNSLVIFPLHPLLINAASGAAKGLGAGPYGPLAWVLLSAWALAACVPIAWMLRRFVPEVLGAPRLALTTSRGAA
jgi:acyltransferase